ncbi:MAG: asparagine synthase (glutamine-hydrolyzing) [Deltaproteobacteria bacterium]|nr:asparagine synthase (glutamine-hydrolyzing) [Deltaproteobacteria bacterium]
MCGIAGHIGPTPITPERIDRCLDLMQRRGPDARGVFRHSAASGRHVLLLHTRLAIIDLDHRSDQPFGLGPQTLVHNGELYNFLELKTNLERQGETFITSGDTEVLLKLLVNEGLKGLDSCRGMWAFALHDRRQETVLLCRDRFGEKPLYYFQDGDNSYFGSEPKFIFALLGRRLEINMDQVCRYLAYGYRTIYKTGSTFFRGLLQVPPGHILILDGNNPAQSQPYWTPTLSTDNRIDHREAVEGVKARLIESVHQKLRADVPLAFCMSGGLDSNALISIAKRIFGYDVHGFTVVSPDERYAEQDLVDYSVKELGIKHTAITLESRDFIPQLQSMVRAHDAPVSTITYYAHWRLMAAIAEHGYKITISGTGADELFAGYYDHHLWYLLETRSEDSWPEAVCDWEKYVKPVIRNPLYRDLTKFLNTTTTGSLSTFRDFDFASYITTGSSKAPEDHVYHPGPLRNRMLNELFHESVPVVLHEDDLNAMFFSLENRSPFLDQSLFEFIYCVPTKYLIGNGYNKKILREALKGIVPPKILSTRTKIGFNAPISDLLPTGQKEIKDRLLTGGLIFDLVDRQKLIDLISRPELTDQESAFIFYFLSARLFLEEFGEKV